MSEQHALLTDLAHRFFADLADKPNTRFEEGWAIANMAGLPVLMLPESAEGFGGGWNDLRAVQWEAGYYASGMPVGEAILANRLCAEAGLVSLSGFGTVVPRFVGHFDRSGFTGQCTNVPNGRHADWIVCISDAGALVRLDIGDGVLTQAENLAGEPRDTIVFENALFESAQIALPMMEAMALLRLGQIAGALSAALSLTIEHAKTRIQFGKPIGSNQVVQQQLAIFAMEASAVECGARAASEVADQSAGSPATWYAIASAKVRANLAIGASTAIAHQIHGAIGFTEEYKLHPLTRRLWSWRTEGGNDRYWTERLGRYVCARGADEAWADIVRA